MQHLNVLNALIAKNPRTEDELSKTKRKLARDFSIGMVTNNWLLEIYKNALEKQKVEKSPELEDVLIKRRVRTLSGVAPITVATKPFPCPGRCVYCPTDVRMPKSYLPSQPAAARALRYKFDPYNQVQGRLKGFYANGHNPEKAELRILGGTWSFYPKRYQTWFVKELYRGLNEFEGHKTKKNTLQGVQEENELAKHRCVGLSIETRPDWITMDEIKRFRNFGVTKVELGVQHLDKKVMDTIKRDHYKEDVLRATKLLKDAGFKVAYHLMPNLPGSTPKKDLAMFKETFEDEGLRPDQLKIYPCVVLEKSQLYAIHQKGEFKTYDDDTLVSLLADMKALVPEYVRIERIYRDVPSHDIIDGSKYTNFRQLVQDEMKKRKTKCVCIRCREVKDKAHEIPKLFIDEYNASGGKEYFISYESADKKTLYAFTRLRFPSKDTKNILPPLKKAAIIRELHTYGQLVPLDENSNTRSQHKGLGKKLLKKAETIAKKEGYDTMAVISGVGVRKYYEKLGYELEENYGYMIKSL